jgi:hypothetical protein
MISSFKIRSGVYVEPNCNTNILGYHAITVVGYGTSSTGINYWVTTNHLILNFAVYFKLIGLCKMILDNP